MKYFAIIDGVVIWGSNSLKTCKKRLDDDYLNCGLGMEARIVSGKKVIAMRNTWDDTFTGGAWIKTQAPAPAELLQKIAEY